MYILYHQCTSCINVHLVSMYILDQCTFHVTVHSHTNTMPIFQSNVLKSQKRGGKKKEKKETFVKIGNTVKLPKIYQFSHVNCKMPAILSGYNLKENILCKKIK